MNILDKLKGFLNGADITAGNLAIKRKTLFFTLCVLVVIAILLSIVLSIQRLSKEGSVTPASVVTQLPEATPDLTTQTATPSEQAATQSPIPTQIPTDEPTLEPEPTEEPTEEPKQPEFINIMTGEPLDEEISKRRPVAYVINNIKKALPQSGIAQASMYYEVLAEGDITRIIAIFQDFDAAKIGSIRSARDYFFDFAYDNDALFAHHGGSPDAYKVIRAGQIDNFDGQDLDGTMFWRDPVRKSTPGMSEHSSYTSMENTLKQVEKYKYRLNKNDSFQGMFQFYETQSSPDGGIPCYDITVSYMSTMSAKFVYDNETNKYLKYQNGNAHIDAETGETLSVTNVIIQKAVIYQKPNDDKDRRIVELVSSGKGYLATNGVYVPITWKKTSHSSPTQWFFEDGTPLTLNVGKTWVSVLPNTREPMFAE